mgnify:CR=1 FL=1
MGQQRMNIRFATIAALTNTDAPPFPTMAEGRVYDSRQDPLMGASGQDSTGPNICVYTDSTKMRPINPQQKPFWPLTYRADLILEMSIGSQYDDLMTDREMEARLDLFESQVMQALFDPRVETAMSWQSTFKRMHEIESVRLANAEHNTRLAKRDLVFDLEYDGACADIASAFPRFERLSAILAIGDEQVAQTEDDMTA